MPLLLLLFVFVFPILALDKKEDNNCHSQLPHLHGSYQDQDGLIWSLSQKGVEFTIRATTNSGVKKEGTGKLQINGNCVWTSQLQWTPSGTTNVKIVQDNGDKDLKIKSQDDNQVWKRTDRGPKLLGFWRDSYGKDWRCIQPNSKVFCWDQRGREIRALLQRAKASDDWTATVNHIGETTPDDTLDVKSESKLNFGSGDTWNRLPCEYKFQCNAAVPSVAGTYKADSTGQSWKILQTGTKITIKKVGSDQQWDGNLRQRPNRCYWGILVPGFKPGLEDGSFFEIAIRPNALFLQVVSLDDLEGQLLDKWRTSTTGIEETEGTLLVAN